jgi:hypothetical protein
MWVKIDSGGVCVRKYILNGSWKTTKSKIAGVYFNYKNILKTLGL